MEGLKVETSTHALYQLSQAVSLPLLSSKVLIVSSHLKAVVSVDTHTFQGLPRSRCLFKILKNRLTIVWFAHPVVVIFLPILILKKLGSREMIIGLVKVVPPTGDTTVSLPQRGYRDRNSVTVLP